MWLQPACSCLLSPVKDFNLYVNEDEIITLIDANGAGKTPKRSIPAARFKRL